MTSSVSMRTTVLYSKLGLGELLFARFRDFSVHAAASGMSKDRARSADQFGFSFCLAFGFVDRCDASGSGAT